MSPEAAAGAGRRRILFLKQGRFSHINGRVEEWLRREFPECELEIVDVLQEIVKPARGMVLRNVAETLAMYGPRIARRRNSLRECFYRTPYFFRSVRELVKRKFGPRISECLFSVQTQSLFDARIEGLPHFVYTDHTHLANLGYRDFDPGMLFAPQWVQLETSIYARARRTLTMSGNIRESLIEQYGRDPERIALVGAASNLDAPAAPLANGDYGNQTVLFVGVEWERKGGPETVAAFRRVLERLPNARLLIAGCSPRIDVPNTEILGRVPLAEISGALLRSCVLALPSRREPQGINCMEAMLHGLPAVVSNTGALPELVEDGRTGYVVTRGDTEALARALTDLLGDPAKCRRFGAAARERAMAEFTTEAVGRRFAGAIRSALEREEKHPRIDADDRILGKSQEAAVPNARI